MTNEKPIEDQIRDLQPVIATGILVTFVCLFIMYINITAFVTLLAAIIWMGTIWWCISTSYKYYSLHTKPYHLKKWESTIDSAKEEAELLSCKIRLLKRQHNEMSLAKSEVEKQLKQIQNELIVKNKILTEIDEKQTSDNVEEKPTKGTSVSTSSSQKITSNSQNRILPKDNY